MGTKGILRVFLGMIVAMAFCQSGFSGPVKKISPKRVRTENTPAAVSEPVVKIRVFNSPSLAIMISQSQSLSELKDVTEKFIDIIYHFDAVAPETVVSSSRAYVEALRTLDSRVQGFGFGAMLEDARMRPEIEAKLEPLKQKLLGYFSISLTSYYLAEMDVLQSPMILRDILATQKLSSENQRMLLNYLVEFHVRSKRNISDFLMENVVKPLLHNNETLRAEYLEALGFDLVEKPLFSEEELFREKTEELAREGRGRGIINREGEGGKIIDLVEAREGAGAGRGVEVIREDPLVRVGRNVHVIGR